MIKIFKIRVLFQHSRLSYIENEPENRGNDVKRERERERCGSLQRNRKQKGENEKSRYQYNTTNTII